jgi:hypothetical protein
LLLLLLLLLATGKLLPYRCPSISSNGGGAPLQHGHLLPR